MNTQELDEVRRYFAIDRPNGRKIIALVQHLDTQEERINRLEAALEKATFVLERTTELFHPNYLLHTATLIQECRDALRKHET